MSIDSILTVCQTRNQQVWVASLFDVFNLQQCPSCNSGPEQSSTASGLEGAEQSPTASGLENSKRDRPQSADREHQRTPKKARMTSAVQRSFSSGVRYCPCLRTDSPNCLWIIIQCHHVLFGNRFHCFGVCFKIQSRLHLNLHEIATSHTDKKEKGNAKPICLWTFVHKGKGVRPTE